MTGLELIGAWTVLILLYAFNPFPLRPKDKDQ